jgi:hypothetical protein
MEQSLLQKIIAIHCVTFKHFTGTLLAPKLSHTNTLYTAPFSFPKINFNNILPSKPIYLS